MWFSKCIIESINNSNRILAYHRSIHNKYILVVVADYGDKIENRVQSNIVEIGDE